MPYPKKHETFCKLCYAEPICKKFNFTLESSKECLQVQFAQIKGRKTIDTARATKELEQLKLF